jgi:hypothetical protein
MMYQRETNLFDKKNEKGARVGVRGAMKAKSDLI